MSHTQTYNQFKPLGKQKKKKQIILCHTSREVNEYLTSLEYRYNSKYDKIPNYIITKTGGILQLLPNDGHTNFFPQENINRNSIIISLENLGWVEKKPLTNYHINWKGSIYKEQVYEKKWRDFFFWEPYTSIQIQRTAELCNNLINEVKIKRNCIMSNTKMEGVENFEGIVSRSNFNEKYTDLNPSFNFEAFRKKINYDEFTE
jgi:N-acetyl-anhydromuramyl-L-alanine amidase AmpD